MAITSAGLFINSSLITYNFYREYINLNAGAHEHIYTKEFVIFFSVLASTGITLGYLNLLVGVIVMPAVVPNNAFTRPVASRTLHAANVSFVLA